MAANAKLSRPSGFGTGTACQACAAIIDIGSVPSWTDRLPPCHCHPILASSALVAACTPAVPLPLPAPVGGVVIPRLSTARGINCRLPMFCSLSHPHLVILILILPLPFPYNHHCPSVSVRDPIRPNSGPILVLSARVAFSSLLSSCPPNLVRSASPPPIHASILVLNPSTLPGWLDREPCWPSSSSGALHRIEVGKVLKKLAPAAPPPQAL